MQAHQQGRGSVSFTSADPWGLDAPPRPRQQGTRGRSALGPLGSEATTAQPALAPGPPASLQPQPIQHPAAAHHGCQRQGEPSARVAGPPTKSCSRCLPTQHPSRRRWGAPTAAPPLLDALLKQQQHHTSGVRLQAANTKP